MARCRATELVVRRMPLQGLAEERRGRTRVVLRGYVEVEPGGVVETDLDVGAWVRSGHLVPCGAEAAPAVIALPPVGEEGATVAEAEAPAAVEAEAEEVVDPPAVAKREPAAERKLAKGKRGGGV